MRTREQVRRFVMDFPDSVTGLEVTREVAAEHEAWQQFAGADVNRRLLAAGLRPFPNLRMLAGYGLLVKVGDSTRGGRRAYWWMPERDEVDRALAELAAGGLRWSDRAVAYAHGYWASHSPFDPTTPGGRTEWSVYRVADNARVKCGWADDVTAAREACQAAIEAELAKRSAAHPEEP